MFANCSHNSARCARLDQRAFKSHSDMLAVTSFAFLNAARLGPLRTLRVPSGSTRVIDCEAASRQFELTLENLRRRAGIAGLCTGYDASLCIKGGARL
jgi:hypothetical protein